MKYRTPRTTLERLKEVLDYNPDTGIFTWVQPTSYRVKTGSVAGSPTGTGHHMISIEGEKLLSHRWAWYWVHGALPQMEIDHINGDPADNRIENLRLVTRSQNMANTKPRSTNSSGVKGVSFDAKSGRWRARIWQNYKCRELGYFNSLEDGAAAYKKAAKDTFGEFAWQQ